MASAGAEPLGGKLSGAEILAATTKDDWRALDPEMTLNIELERGRVVIALSSLLAQKHVANIKKLARAGFYDGLTFYRVIDGFVAQGGDVLESRGADQQTLAAQFDEPAPKDIAFYPWADADGYAPRAGFVDGIPIGTDANANRIWHIHCTGAVAIAREEKPDTASTEFYIALQPQRYLDRNLTVVGRVVDGMQHVQALRRVQPTAEPSSADDLGEKILSIKVAADVPAAERTALEILDSGRPAFDAFVEARRNRPEGFFTFRPNFIDICQLPVPVRAVGAP
ncbi:MAG: peptidylprolyl isomerase [Parvularculaceae bacterium]